MKLQCDTYCNDLLERLARLRVIVYRSALYPKLIAMSTSPHLILLVLLNR